MATLDRMPSQAIIDDLKGVIDFYYWKGIPCARRWPTWVKRTATTREKANQDAFTYAIMSYAELPPVVRQFYVEMAAGTNVTARDLFLRAYLKGQPK